MIASHYFLFFNLKRINFITESLMYHVYCYSCFPLSCGFFFSNEFNIFFSKLSVYNLSSACLYIHVYLNHFDRKFCEKDKRQQHYLLCIASRQNLWVNGPDITFVVTLVKKLYREHAFLLKSSLPYKFLLVKRKNVLKNFYKTLKTSLRLDVWFNT